MSSSALSAPRPLFELGRGAAYLVGTAAAVRLAEVLVGRNPLVAALVGAVIVDLATYRVGVRWEPETEGKARTTTQLGRGAAVGLGVGLVLAFVPLGAAALASAAKVSLGAPSLSLGFALLRAGATAARDELLLRGVPLAVAARVGFGQTFALVYGALASVSVLLLDPHATWESMVLAASQGLLFGVLWARTRAAWASVFAHAAFLFFVGAGQRGGLLDVAWGSAALTDVPRSQGWPALFCAALALGLAALVWKKWSAAIKDSPTAASTQSTPE